MGRNAPVSDRRGQYGPVTRCLSAYGPKRDLGAPCRTVWIGRRLDATGDDPLRAVNIGSVLPPLAVGAKAAAAALPIGTSKRLAASPAQALTALGRPDPTDTPAHAMVCAGYRADRRVDATFGGIIDSKPTSDDDQDQSPGGMGGAGTDFRVVYSELLAKVLGTDPGHVLARERAGLGLITWPAI